MKILGIETSCDDTAIAIVSSEKKIISNIVFNQQEHKEYGGVVPEIAARCHSEVIDKLIDRVIQDSDLHFLDIDAIACTAGPGLIGGVIVGLMAGKTIASIYKKPFIAINHLEGHALTARLTNNVKFPYLLLLVSGGHCQILLIYDIGRYQKIGDTIDDALGESFDKVAQMLGLDYPGGPKIEKVANNGNDNKYNFPKPLLLSQDRFNFSFSGLKTAVRRQIEFINRLNNINSVKSLKSQDIADVAASFQKTVLAILNNRLSNALQLLEDDGINISSVVISGGVAANQYLCRNISCYIRDRFNLNTVSPPIDLCTDNAAMIAWAGIERFKKNMTSDLDFKPKSRWDL